MIHSHKGQPVEITDADGNHVSQVAVFDDESGKIVRGKNSQLLPRVLKGRRGVVYEMEVVKLKPGFNFRFPL